jgi:hypothetical protein
VEALAGAWKVSVEEILATNDLDRETEVLIGKEGEREIRDDAIRVIRPKTKGVSN